MQHGAEIKAGGFVLLALALFIIFVWVLGSERQMFASQIPFHALFKDVKGLADGAPVRLGGITIGRVSKIAFPKDYHDPNIVVTILVNEEYLDRIRADSLVTIETQGLLGDRFVSITTGTGNLVLPKAVLKTAEPADIAQVLQKAQTIVDNTVKISQSINKFLGEEGGEQALASASKSLKSLGSILDKVENGSGFLHNLVYKDDPDNALIKNLTNASGDLSAVVKEVRSGDGLLHAFIFEKGGRESKEQIVAALKNLADLAGQMSAVAVEIKDGKGLLHDLIYAKSPQSVGDILGKFSQTADNLKKASDALASGQGTLGALLIDPRLYENLVEVTDGAKRSFLLRQAIRSSLDK